MALSAAKFSAQGTIGGPLGNEEAPSKWAPPATLIILLAFFIVTSTAPFGNGSLVTGLTVYSELFAESWDEFGFGASRGVPMASCVGTTVADRLPYAHQAPIGWWFPYLGRAIFGKTDFGFRSFSALFCVLGVAIVANEIRKRTGALSAFLWTLLVLALPVTLIYGAMPGIESISLFLGAGFAAAFERWRDDPTPRRRALMMIAFLAGTQVAWSFYFLAPGFLAAEFLRPKDLRRFRAPLLLFPLGVLGFALVVAHLLLGTGSFDAVFGDVLATAGSVVAGDTSSDPFLRGRAVHFFPSQGRFLLENLGILLGPVGLLAAVLVLALERGRRDPLTRLALAFSAQGFLTVVLFQGRSNTHGYYWFLMGPPAALWIFQCARLGVARSRASNRKSAAVITAALILGAAGSGIAGSLPLIRATYRPGLEQLARSIDSQVPQGDWICSFDTLTIEAMLYSSRRWTPPLVSRDHVDQVLAARAAGRIKMMRLWIWMNRDHQLMPELAKLKAYLDELSRTPGAERRELGDNLVYVL